MENVQPKKKRNGELDFWKFIAALFVALYHSHSIFDREVFPKHGALAVEFFFIVTGYLFAASVYRDKRPYDRNTIGSETLCFMTHKIKGFLGVWIYGYALSLLVTVIGDPAFWKAGKFATLSKVVSDFLLLKAYGFGVQNVLSASWYLSSMLFALFVLYPLFRKNKEVFSKILSPLIGLVTLGIIFRATGSLFGSIDTQLVGKGTMRAFAGICLGVFAYVLAEALSQKENTKVRSLLYSVVDVGAIVGAFLMIFFMNSAAQPLLILLFFVFVVISGSRQAAVTDLYCNRASAFLGKFSLSIYLTHCAVRSAMIFAQKRFPEFGKLCHTYTAKNLIITFGIYLAATFILALFGQWLTDKISASLKAKKTPERAS